MRPKSSCQQSAQQQRKQARSDEDERPAERGDEGEKDDVLGVTQTG